MELILTPEYKRYTLFPIRHPKIWDAYKNQEASVWHAHEIDLSGDLVDWIKLTDNERFFLKRVLAFFASSDIIVNQNLAERFSREVMILEAKIAYDFQKFIENVHSEMYSLLLDTYVTDAKEKEEIFDAVENVPVIKKKAEWAKKWIEGNQSFPERLVAFSLVEGLFFSGSFCAIYWIKEKGILPGLCTSNNVISRDEGMHTDFAILLHSMLVNKCPVERMHEIVKEAVELEIEFIVDALPCNLLGMNSAKMSQYIKYVANRLVISYEYPEIYPQITNPFPFMERLNLKAKSNFFEKKPTEYNKRSTVEEEDEDPYKDC